MNYKEWWNGPEFLRKSKNYWPNFQNMPIERTTIESKKSVLIGTTSCVASNDASPIKLLIDRLSSYTLMLRVLSNCARFAEICLNEKVPYITTQHLQRSEDTLIRWFKFGEEIQKLKMNKPIHRSK